MVLRIFLRVIEQSLHQHCPGAAQVDKAALHIGAVAFIHRFGASLNEHVHFHVCVVDGVFELVPGQTQADPATAPGIIFHPAAEIDETAVAQAQADLRRRILRAFVGRGLIESFDAKEMLAYKHSGFSVDTSVCIEAHDRAAQERLLRYCARPPFAMGIACAKRAATWCTAAPNSTVNPPGGKVAELVLTPLELIACIAALVPPKRSPAHYLWVALIERIYEVFPLVCPMCGGQMRLIAFITEGAQIRKILDHIGVDSEPPRISPARGPPLWEDCDASVGDGVQIEPGWDLAAQPAPDYEIDQRVNW